MQRAPASAGRVLGWDLLRGLCALAVASYHLMYWQGIASVNTLGSYGVYLFFILSGASLTYNYESKLTSLREAAGFMVVRWMRLAPLYILLCIVYVAMQCMYLGRWVGNGFEQVPMRVGLNLSFLYGLHDPTLFAILIGGWSLGIEFIYYLAFPFLLKVLPSTGRTVVVGIGLAVVQWTWIQLTAGSPAGYTASAVAYHQVPAFVAYFFGGCVIGHWRRRRGRAIPLAGGAMIWLGMAALLLALNPAQQGDELLGLRGVVLPVACFLVVLASGRVEVDGWFRRPATWLGDITYGCYLMHPLFIFGFLWFVLPQWTAGAVDSLPLAVRWAILGTVLALSCLSAAASERWFESPLRRWAKRIIRHRTTPDQREAASISS